MDTKKIMKGRSQKNFSLYIIKKVTESSLLKGFILKEDNVVVMDADTARTNQNISRKICLYQKNINNIFMRYGRGDYIRSKFSISRFFKG